MRVMFYHAGKDFEEIVADHFCAGVTVHGDHAFSSKKGDYAGPPMDLDVIVVMGVTGNTSRILKECKAAGKIVVYVDKGYNRIASEVRRGLRILYYKVSLGGFQPLDYITTDMPGDRWDAISERHGLELVRERRREGECIVYSGPSAKNAKFHGLGDPTEYAKSVIREIRKRTDKLIIYRPKKSWRDAVPVKGAEFSGPKEKADNVYDRAFVYAVHNSNSCVEAVMRDIPTVSLGPSIAYHISRHDFVGIDNIEHTSYESRYQFMSNVCYWQWTLDEMKVGKTWNFLKGMINDSSVRT